MLAQTDVEHGACGAAAPEDDTRITADEPNALDEDALVRFIDVVRERWSQRYTLILVLFTTTTRTSTIRALRWRTSTPRPG